MNSNPEYKGTADHIRRDPEMRSCFESLPPIVRESILMSCDEISSAGQLRKLADELMRKADNQ